MCRLCPYCNCHSVTMARADHVSICVLSPTLHKVTAFQKILSTLILEFKYRLVDPNFGSRTLRNAACVICYTDEVTKALIGVNLCV